MKLTRKKASVDVTEYIFIQDSSLTTGAGKTGLAFDTASLVCYYVRPLAAAAVLTLATQTVTGAHSDGGFVEVSAANMPGVYRLDLSDAICATGVNSVVVMLKGAANMAPVVLEIQLVSYDPNDAVALGLTNLDAAISTRTKPADTQAAVTLVATTTNLTNAPTAGDLTATMKTSVTTAATAATPTAAAVTGAVGSVTGLTASNLDAAISTRATPAQVNTEVVDALATDAYAEPAQGAPGATISLAAKINHLFKAWRNNFTQSATDYKLYNDAGTVVDAKATVSDDATTFTRGKIGTGP